MCVHICLSLLWRRSPHLMVNQQHAPTATHRQLPSPQPSMASSSCPRTTTFPGRFVSFTCRSSMTMQRPLKPPTTLRAQKRSPTSFQCSDHFLLTIREVGDARATWIALENVFQQRSMAATLSYQRVLSKLELTYSNELNILQ